MSEFRVGDKVREIRHPESVGHVYELHPTENKVRIQWLVDGVIGRRFSDADNYELVPSEALYRIREKGNARTLYRGDTVLAFESGTPQADSELILVCDYLNQETAKLQSEIASLQQANADLLAAAEVRSEELGKARRGLEDMHQIRNIPPSKYRALEARFLADIVEEMLKAIEETYKRYVMQWEAQEGESEAVE